VNDNLRAFLNMIAFAEGTAKAPDPYRVTYSYAYTVRDLAFHPAELRGAATAQWREWGGERLPDAMCRGAGRSPGCVSTAAGKYQMILPTWHGCKLALRLPDFGPASQDAAAVHLITRRGALLDVTNGRLVAAIKKVRSEWASMPGAGVAQPERNLAALTQAFVAAGGNLA
jgi:muramidase (phage lysozyme)